MNTESTESKKPRLLFLDNIKLLFAILVIFQHVRITYGGAGVWYYIEGGDLDLLSIIFFQILTSFGGLFQSSLMGLFFLMGAFFTPKSSVLTHHLLEKVAMERFHHGYTEETFEQ